MALLSQIRYFLQVQITICSYTIISNQCQRCHYTLKLAATLRGSRPGVQSASLIMMS